VSSYRLLALTLPDTTHRALEESALDDVERDAFAREIDGRERLERAKQMRKLCRGTAQAISGS
jgi:hypothetical protein